uniref:TolC family protein n=1 Tax=Geobacter metallireducens TaxID=28232 RepID=A0A831U1H0_GEOME
MTGRNFDSKEKSGSGAAFSLFPVALLLCVVLLLPGISISAEPRVLTLEQALEIAAERNRDILKAREFHEQVKGRYVEERAAALPHLTITGQASTQHDESQKAFPGGFMPADQDSYGAELGLSQALYTWGKVGAAIRAAEKGFLTADERLRMARQDVWRDVSVAFYNILLAREHYDIASQNLAQKVRHLDEAQRKHGAGVATDYDVLAAEVAVQNAMPDVIRAGNDIRVARDRLAFLLALDGEVDVQGTLETSLSPCPAYDEALSVAREKRPEIREISHRLAIADELVRVADADDKPRLDLKGGYGWRHLEIGDSSGSGPLWTVGLHLSFPIFDGLKTRGKVAQAESERRSIRIDEAKLLESVALDIRDAVNAVRESEEIVKALAGTVVQAERLLQMAEKGFELGVKIRLEVDDAELNLRQARANLARARRDYLVARVNLERVMGVLGEKKN